MSGVRVTYLTSEQRRDPKYMRKIAKQIRYIGRKLARKYPTRKAA